MPVGQFALRSGPCMASSNEFKITIRGKGAHAAMPHNGIDPVPAACQMVQAFQTIISRNKRPIDAGVISVTMIHTGEATNVIPESCEIQGTVRTFTLEVLDLIERRMREIATPHLRRVRHQLRLRVRAQLPADDQPPGRDRFRARRAGRPGRRGQRHRLRADDGRRGLQLLPAREARLLLPRSPTATAAIARAATAWARACCTTRATTSTTS